MQLWTGVVPALVLALVVSACSAADRPTLAGGDQEVTGPTADVEATTTPTPIDEPEPDSTPVPVPTSSDEPHATPAPGAPDGGWLSVFERCDDVERPDDISMSDEEAEDRQERVRTAIGEGLAPAGGASSVWGALLSASVVTRRGEPGSRG